MWIRYGLLGLLAVFLSFTSKAQQVKPLGLPPIMQVRGLWVDAFGAGFKNQTEVNTLIGYAQTMKINALFVQVGRRMDCFCNRASVPRSADPKLAANFDPLQAILEKAKPLGIQVHAWVITTAAFNSTEPLFSAKHVMATHGRTAPDPWVTMDATGNSRVGKDEILDVGHPAAADYIVRFYTSLLENYDLDGIQFDRVRYPDSGDAQFRPLWGYNPTALKRFQTETARTDIPNPTDEQWSQWRRDQITNVVRRVYLEAKMIKPNAWVSAATITYKAAPRTLEEFKQTRTYKEVLQDWAGWTAAGILDMNIPMNYKREYDATQAKEFDGWNNFASTTRENAVVLSGLGFFVNKTTDSSKQLARALKTPGISGFVGYSYRTTDLDVLNSKKTETNGRKDFQKIFSPIFANQVQWTRAPTNKLSGFLGRVTQAGTALSNAEIEIQASDGSSLLLRTDANGYYGVPRLPIGKTKIVLLQRAGNTVTVSSSLEFTVIQRQVQRITDLVAP